MNDIVIRVVKVGGSLFDLPDLPARIIDRLAAQPSGLNIIVAGGGERVEELRQAEKAVPLTTVGYHWLCVRALATTAEILAEWLRPLPFIRGFDELQATISFRLPSTCIFDVFEFLHEHEGQLPGEVLPQDWSVTSDSIAARLARVIDADELVLFKSATVPAGSSLEDLAKQGYVDAFFPQAAEELPLVRLVNLRD